MSIVENMKRIEERINRACERVHRDRNSVTLVIAGKYATADQLWDVFRAGGMVIGENKVQDARDKKPLLDPRVRWHMIGHLQTNKVKQAIGLFDMIHAVDSLRLAAEINKQSGKVMRVTDCLLEVNIAGEKSKYGFKPAEVVRSFEAIASLQNVRILGLMCMAPYDDDPEKSRVHFRALADLRDELQHRFLKAQLPHLSMGMTQDF
ncbi:MAG TPA: YggS family pyridoxal phosphate-dependent enzyme, partial [bacterium]|nr:YggS family pyridoxal phosphate-dependent enzyme [bacterium]